MYIGQHLRRELEREAKEKAYRVYVTDALYALVKHMNLTKRWADMQAQPEEIKETADEIIARMKTGLNGKEGANHEPNGACGDTEA